MWKHLKINNNHYYAYLESNCDSIATVFSDLTCYWKETLLVSQAISRFVELNPVVKAEDDIILEYIQSLLEEENNELLLESTGEMVKFSIKTSADPIVKYFFEFSKQPQETIYREMTLPMILLINELNYRQELLFKQLEEKDVELLEYKLEGFKITRKNVITEKFIKDDFKKSVKEGIESRLKSGINKVSETFLQSWNEWHPLYKRAVDPYDTEQLKQGNIPQENLLQQVKNEVKQSPPKRRYITEPNVPLKRAKTSKKKIL